MSRNAIRPFWSYYGSRYQLVPYYPRPAYRQIVEPFAGAAAYSLHYPDCEVLLCDLDPQIANLWQYLIRVSEAEILSLRDVVEHVDELGPVSQEARCLVGFWLGRCTSRPRSTVGSWMIRGRAERPADFWGRAARERIASQLQYIRHWRVCCADYRAMSYEGIATWFVDPPFHGKGGRRYRMGSSAIDFEQLGQWCRERAGQILVCEQLGATWLAFAEAAKGRGMRSERTTLLWSNEPVPGQLQLLPSPIPQNTPHLTERDERP
jgi:hypothetical protein